MKIISGKQLCKILQKMGWELMRVQGSHRIYGNKSSVEIIVVPVHRNKYLEIGILKSIMKRTQITEEDL